MSTPRSVRHISGQGEMWEVIYELTTDYKVYARGGVRTLLEHHYLPKSEYVICEPPPPPAPERWVDVTRECLPIEKDGVDLWHENVGAVFGNGVYRLRKEELWSLDKLNRLEKAVSAFLVEQKEQL